MKHEHREGKHGGRKHGGRKYGRRIAVVLGAVLAASILFLWGWNTLAAELFGAPPALFKHGLAVSGLLLGAVLLTRAGLGTARRQ